MRKSCPFNKPPLGRSLKMVLSSLHNNDAKSVMRWPHISGSVFSMLFTFLVHYLRYWNNHGSRATSQIRLYLKTAQLDTCTGMSSMTWTRWPTTAACGARCVCNQVPSPTLHPHTWDICMWQWRTACIVIFVHDSSH